jgi:hypothetical protein
MYALGSNPSSTLKKKHNHFKTSRTGWPSEYSKTKTWRPKPKDDRRGKKTAQYFGP